MGITISVSILLYYNHTTTTWARSINMSVSIDIASTLIYNFYSTIIYHYEIHICVSWYYYYITTNIIILLYYCYSTILPHTMGEEYYCVSSSGVLNDIIMCARW